MWGFLQDTLAEHHAPTKLNLYPVKRDLEKQMAATTEELAKAEREADGLAKMVSTYQSHPKYGKADTFREELKAANLRVQDIENHLAGLKAQHADIDRRLESLKGDRLHRTADVYSEQTVYTSPGPILGQRNNGARVSSSPSIKSSLSVGSSSGASSQSAVSYQTGPPSSIHQSVSHHSLRLQQVTVFN